MPGYKRRGSELVGKWFHSFDPKTKAIRWQGQILEVNQGVYLVQLYSWLDGRPTDKVKVQGTEMTNWKFYDDDETMRKYSSYYSERFKQPQTRKRTR